MTTTAATPIATGLLAYGMSGKIFHAPFLTAHPGFALRSVLERSTPRMAPDYPQVRSYPSAEALLADSTLELVVVNTPNDTHLALARQVLLAGKHVLLEKPVAATAAEVRELFALARQQNRHLLAYQNRRWDTDFTSVREVVQSGQLGQLLEAHFRYDRYRPALSPKLFKEDPARPASGLHYDLGPHILDQALSLFGRPLAWERVAGSHRPGSQVADFFNFHLTYASGLHLWLTGSLLVADPGPAYVLHGTQGSYVKHRTDPQEAQLLAGTLPNDPAYGHEQPGQEGSLTLVAPDGQLTTRAVAAAPGNYRGLFEAVHQTIRHGQPYPITEDDLVAQLDIIAG